MSVYNLEFELPLKEIEDKIDEDVLRVKRIYYDVFENDTEVIK